MVETTEGSDEMSSSVFMESGIFRFEKNSNVVFMDPVRALNCSYSRYRVSPSAYYSRRFFSFFCGEEEKQTTRVSERTRKRKKKSIYVLNEREQSADQRHQEARPLLLKAYEALLGVKDLLLSPIRDVIKSSGSCSVVIRQDKDVKQSSFIELGSVWQAPMYTISLLYHHHHHHLHHPPRDNSFDDDDDDDDEDAGLGRDQSVETRVMLPVFNNLIRNEATDEMEAEFLNHSYIVPGESCFYMSDLKLIRDLIPATPDNGFNFIVIDPPWENGSASQKSVYPTLPGRYFLSLPIKQLTHTEGALVALWVTNKEKLRSFIEKELFPMWGVSHTATFYWLKVKADGSLISELDLFHHRPYECLLLGYCHREGMEPKDPSTFKRLQENHVTISIPGEYSRKPPLWKLLLEYVPGPKPARCIELFARELFTGWTSWGNEPLHFQESKYFMNKET